jgi:hypothetical protein
MNRSPRAPAILLYLTTVISVASTACIYDSSDRCGPASKYVEAVRACVCDDNAIPVLGGCQACPDTQVASGGKCACPAGETPDANNKCATIAGLGDACTTSTDCKTAPYTFCGQDDKCTNTCASNSDCGAAYTCATWEAQPYCRTFTGFGDTCVSSTDCTGDAKYCDTNQTHTCDVQGCSLTDNDCPRGTMCCDFSSFGLGTLCAESCQ